MSGMSEHTPTTFVERLWPSFTFFIALLLIIPALTVLFTPFSLESGIIAGVISYVAVSALFVIAARKVKVQDGKLIAGRAAIDVQHLGTIEVLDDQELKVAIGRTLDARAYLWITGWVKSGVRIEITDPADPTPYWVVSTRRPKELSTVIRNAQASRV